MNEKTAILNVRMLGDFSITYDGRQVSFGKNTTTKAMKLLQILIYYFTMENRALHVKSC